PDAILAHAVARGEILDAERDLVPVRRQRGLVQVGHCHAPALQTSGTGTSWPNSRRISRTIEVNLRPRKLSGPAQKAFWAGQASSLSSLWTVVLGILGPPFFRRWLVIRSGPHVGCLSLTRFTASSRTARRLARLLSGLSPPRLFWDISKRRLCISRLFS